VNEEAIAIIVLQRHEKKNYRNVEGTVVTAKAVT
jgi:hypothetical protein